MSVTLDLTAANINDNFSQLENEIQKITNGVTLNNNGKDEDLIGYSLDAINYLKSAIYAKACYEKLKDIYKTYENDEAVKKADMPYNIRLIRDIKDALFDAFNNFYYKQGLLKLFHTPVGTAVPRLVTEQIAEKLLVDSLENNEGILRDKKGFIEKCLGEDISDTIDNIPAKGIPNVGNTCYFNSIIQFLNRIKPFVRELLDYQISNEFDDKFQLTINSLKELFKKLNNSSDLNFQHEDFNFITELSNKKDYSPIFFRCGQQHDNYELFLFIITKILFICIPMNYIKINSVMDIICDGATKNFFENSHDITIEHQPSDIHYCLTIYRFKYEGQEEFNIITCLNNSIHMLQKISKGNNKEELKINGKCNDKLDNHKDNYFVTKTKYYVQNDNQYLIFFMPVTVNEFTNKTKIAISNIIMFYSIDEKKIYYRPIALTRGHFGLKNMTRADGAPIIHPETSLPVQDISGGHYIFQSIQSNERTEMKSVLNISDSNVNVIDVTPNNDTGNTFNTSVLYQRIDENDKIYLDKDLKAIFDFVFETKFKIDKAFYLIHIPENPDQDSHHINENIPFIRQILTDIGIDLTNDNLGDFPDIRDQIMVCDVKYKDDKDYQFIKQIYENIKTERNILNNLIKNYATGDLNTYLTNTFNK